VKREDAPEWVRQLDDLYDRAIARADRLHDYWRDYAFLGLDEEIGIAGDPETRAARIVRVRQLTLQMFIELCAVRSPFLVGGPVRPEHVAQILWRLSPEYSEIRDQRSEIRKDNQLSGPTSDLRPLTSEQTPRQKFIERIASLPFRPSVRAISRYLDRMLIDRPASNAKANGAGADTSFAASVVHAFASLYGWSDETILNLPMPALFQYLRKIQQHHNPEAISFYPLRDRVTQKIFQKYQERKKSETADHADNADKE